MSASTRWRSSDTRLELDAHARRMVGVVGDLGLDLVGLVGARVVEADLVGAGRDRDALLVGAPAAAVGAVDEDAQLAGGLAAHLEAGVAGELARQLGGLERGGGLRGAGRLYGALC